MENLIFPYEIKDDYYGDVDDFAVEFIEFANSLNLNDLSVMLEGLLIGVYWKVYKIDAINLSINSYKMLSTLSRYRNKSLQSKDLIDDVRGLILTKQFENEKVKKDLNLNKDNLKVLLNFLEATGDFVYQLPYLKKYEHEITQEKLNIFIQLSDWFLRNSPKYLGLYTLQLKEYLKSNNHFHKMNEDIIFFNSPEELYHLNMLGANLMNRIFKEDFQLRKRKALLLPSCMKISRENCNAENSRLGPICRLCNKKCNVYKIAKEFPHELYLIEHNSDSLKNATKKDLDELGIIGVTCVLNLISGVYQSSKMGIPPQCVLLNRVSCAKHWMREDIPSTIDFQELSNKI
ncbi:DUF116 domain-containing protein [Methanobrevibacter sp.]|uniref:DUF116 domain-containing protein n=1 Tax=Methanobrevibacter sp. TaxID=66852 RepID=UPI003D7E48BE